MYYIYVLKCKNDDLYIGYTTNLRLKLKSHTIGKVKATKSKLPVSLIYYESYLDKHDAAAREKQLKMHKPKEDLKKQIKNSRKKL